MTFGGVLQVYYKSRVMIVIHVQPGSGIVNTRCPFHCYQGTVGVVGTQCSLTITITLQFDDLCTPGVMWVLCIFSPVYVQSHVMALQQREVVPPEVCQPSYMGPLYRPLPSVSWIQPQRNPMVIQPRLHQVIGGDYMTPQQYPHPQLLQAHPHSYSAMFDHAVQGYRPVQYTHQMVPQGQQQMYPQSVNPGVQQYHPSQQQAMLAARQPTPQHQGMAYGSMMHQPHTLGPLPQYPSVPMHQPPSLKTTGSLQVFRHQIPTYRLAYILWLPI